MTKHRNCHYVSRFLTTPWEVENRELHFYSFESGRVDHKTSKRLFAKDKLNSLNDEQRLNELIETPLSATRHEIANGRREAKDWREYRAFALLLMLQPVRSSAALEARAHGKHLAMFLAMSDQELDSTIVHWLSGHQLVTYRLAEREQLLFPSTGIFVLPVFDVASPGGIDFVECVPIDPKTFVSRVSHTADFGVFGDSASNGFYYAGNSVGLHSELVVIPPKLLRGTNQEIAESLTAWRTTARQHVKLILQLQELARIQHVRTGVKPDLRARYRAVIAKRDASKLEHRPEPR